jgi:hypothetical protein
MPRSRWRVKAGGPEGRDNLLVFVADGPRDLAQLAASKAASQQECNNASRNKPLCSDAYGATMVTVDEVR